MVNNWLKYIYTVKDKTCIIKWTFKCILGISISYWWGEWPDWWVGKGSGTGSGECHTGGRVMAERTGKGGEYCHRCGNRNRKWIGG